MQLHEYRTFEYANLVNPFILGCSELNGDSNFRIKFRIVRSNFFIAYYMQDEDAPVFIPYEKAQVAFDKYGFEIR